MKIKTFYVHIFPPNLSKRVFDLKLFNFTLWWALGFILYDVYIWMRNIDLFLKNLAIYRIMKPFMLCFDHLLKSEFGIMPNMRLEKWFTYLSYDLFKFFLPNLWNLKSPIEISILHLLQSFHIPKYTNLILHIKVLNIQRSIRFQ